jgi:thiol-disulfide isomerase/thioredoxin
MKNLFLFIVILFAVLIVPVHAQSNANPAEINAAFSRANLPLLRKSVPIMDFTLPTLDGKNVTLSALKGSVVFLNFWATWCPPCRAEMPSMEVLYQRYRGKGLVFLAVDIGEERGDVAEFMDTLGLSFPAALDSSGSVGGRYGVRGIPTTFIIDRQGQIILSTVGGRQWDTPAVFSAFDLLLK